MNNSHIKTSSIETKSTGLGIAEYISLFTSRLWRTSRTAYLIRKHSSLINTKTESRENELHKLIMLLLIRKLRKEAIENATKLMQRLHD